ncbi:hypothetical protein KC19_12G126300 [Ceratodon purpureus]|uniref:Arabinanase/levansucrase/invertase n=1 Tax=Ceratodon purpureus TaxID=3225 RepID=A0A8T0G8T9_CERPU|nr:hypothetical protein KC19_12G126300 [Ceratodon purpureus]
MGSLSSPSLSVARASGCNSPIFQTFSPIPGFEYSSKTLECLYVQRLVSSRTDVKTLNCSRRSSRIAAIIGQRGCGAGQDPGQETPSSESSDCIEKPELDHEGFVISSGEKDAWNSGRVGSPIVRRYVSDNEERWCMWYSGENVDGSSGTTRRGKEKVDTKGHGEDGAVGQVLDRSENWWAFDTQHLYPFDVLIMSSAKVRAASGVYWLYYSGADAEEMSLPSSVTSATPPASERFLRGRMRLGLAISNDGRNWARVEGDHYSGALFDVGAEGEWDSLFIDAPQVVFHEAGDIRMYYHSLDPNTGKYSVGFAQSRDAMRWLKFGKILDGGGPGSFDEFGIAARHVVENPDGSGYLMAYEGVAANGRTSIGLAKSEAGLLKWERCQEQPIFQPAESAQAWDSAGVGSPCLVHMDGNKWSLYYVGVSANGSLIEFKRWHNFRPQLKAEAT